jgi:hypothetical protein
MPRRDDLRPAFLTAARREDFLFATVGAPLVCALGVGARFAARLALRFVPRFVPRFARFACNILAVARFCAGVRRPFLPLRFFAIGRQLWRPG